MNESPEAMKDRIQEMVLDHGFAIHYIGGDQPYGYTIGRTMKGRPELLISGLPQHITSDLLTLAITSDDSELIEIGRPRGRILNQPVFPIAIDPWAAEMHGAIAVFGIVSAMQLLWPDDLGRYPGDPDCALLPSVQRVFA